MDFNFEVPIEEEEEGSDSDDEADLVVFSDAPSFVPLTGEPKIEAHAKASSPTSITGTSPSDLYGLEVWVTEAA